MTTIVDSNLPVARPSWEHSRLESRIVHLGCGAFHHILSSQPEGRGVMYSGKSGVFPAAHFHYGILLP